MCEIIKFNNEFIVLVYRHNKIILNIYYKNLLLEKEQFIIFSIWVITPKS